MPTECDLCHWNNKELLSNHNCIPCAKGEQVWSGLQGLLRLEEGKITYDPCPHNNTSQELPLTRFQRILQDET